MQLRHSLIWLLATISILLLAFNLPQNFSIFGLKIYSYSLFILLGIFVAAYLFEQKRKQLKLLPEVDITDGLIFTVVGGIIGARLWHIVFDWEQYTDNLLQVFDFRSGGLGFYGALIGGIIGIYIYQRIKKFNALQAIDLLVVYLPLGHAIGRFGNMINQELYGPPTELPWGQYIEATRMHHHPAFFYEQIGNILLFIILSLVLRKKMPGNGIFLAIYVAGYSLIKFFVDFFRLEAEVIASLTLAQLSALIIIPFAIIYIYWRLNHEQT